MTRPYAEPERGLLLAVSYEVMIAAFFIHDQDPDKLHAAGTQQWARENRLEDWP